MNTKDLAHKIQILSQKYNQVVREQKWSIALEISQQMIEINPKSAICYNYRGFAYFKLLQFDRARLDFEHVLIIDASNKNAKIMLSKTHTQLHSLHDENETIPLSQITKPTANENTETQTLEHLKSKPKPAVTTDGFIEEKTTQVIPQTKTTELLSSVSAVLEGNQKPVSKISKQTIIVASSMLVIGILCGLLLLPNKNVVHLENEGNNNTVFDSSTNNKAFEKIANLKVPLQNEEPKSTETFVQLTVEKKTVYKNEITEKKLKNPIDPTNSEIKSSNNQEPENKDKKNTFNENLDEEVNENINEEVPNENIDEEIPDENIAEATEEDYEAIKDSEKPQEINPPILVDVMGIEIDLRKSKNIVFVVDNSSSMKKQVIEYKKSRNDLIIKGLGSLIAVFSKHNTNIGCVLFNKKVILWDSKLKIAGSTSFQKFFTKNKPQPGANVYDALYKALKMKSVDTIFLIADGSPGTGKYVTHRDILQNIKNINNSKIQIHTIAMYVLGSTKNFLQKLAQENRGKFYLHK